MFFEYDGILKPFDYPKTKDECTNDRTRLVLNWDIQDRGNLSQPAYPTFVTCLALMQKTCLKNLSISLSLSWASYLKKRQGSIIQTMTVSETSFSSISFVWRLYQKVRTFYKWKRILWSCRYDLTFFRFLPLICVVLILIGEPDVKLGRDVIWWRHQNNLKSFSNKRTNIEKARPFRLKAKHFIIQSSFHQ